MNTTVFGYIFIMFVLVMIGQVFKSTSKRTMMICGILVIVSFINFIVPTMILKTLISIGLILLLGALWSERRIVKSPGLTWQYVLIALVHIVLIILLFIH